MTILITLLSLLISLAIFAGALYLAKYVVTIQHRVSVLEDEYKRATDHIAAQEETILQLNQEAEFSKREATIKNNRTEPNRSWDPNNMLNDQERKRA